MTLAEIKRKLIDTIEAHQDEICRIGDEILRNPECGYCEEKTSALVRRELEKWDIAYDYPCALTGVKGKLRGRESNANVCIIGEMDALWCAGSPIANETGIAHACGHNAQVAAMLGAAIAFAGSGAMAYLDGDVTFLAAPAEEFIDMEYRKSLKESGKIAYYGGKQQLIAEGMFDDVDMAMMVHAQPNEPKAKLFVQGKNLGFLAKTITFHGKAVHGSMPFDGVNALNAAALAILGVHANRETFREEEKIRIHPIITKGGDVVNSVPAEVCMDTYVRGASYEAIQKGNRTVENAAKGAADMVGAAVTFEDIPGYLPLKESKALSEVFERNAAQLVGQENLVYGADITGSSDIGDLSSILPVIQPSVGGFAGTLHERQFHITEKRTAYVLPAKIVAITVAELLYNHAETAKQIKKNFEAKLTKEEYRNYLEGKV
ncbi:MAG: amidohydrolase [Clostridia bacterium]|nr:amidohydrolase [Clostridia bacterium]